MVNLILDKVGIASAPVVRGFRACGKPTARQRVKVHNAAASCEREPVAGELLSAE
jgi:hypothetical protein